MARIVPGHDCLAYEAEEAESLNHVWPEIQAARATIILAMIFAVPLLIILLISMCNFCCTYAPYGAASVFAVIQLISIIAGRDARILQKKNQDFLNNKRETFMSQFSRLCPVVKSFHSLILKSETFLQRKDSFLSKTIKLLIDSKRNLLNRKTK